MGERFAAAQWSTLMTGSPVPDGAIASFDCEITHSVSVGTHDILFCQVMALVSNPAPHGLVWFDRRYHPLTRQEA